MNNNFKISTMKTIKRSFAGGLIRTCSLILMSLLFVQCIGPRGPQGLDGQDGLDGINYTKSIIYDVAVTTWEGDLNGYYSYLNVPEINDDIYYDGAVLVYRLIETTPKSFNMLPYTYMDNLLTIYMDFDAYVGGIDLIYKEVYDGVNDTQVPEMAMAFKVIIIEGIPIAKVKTMVDVNDFAAVSKMFNIESSNTVAR